MVHRLSLAGIAALFLFVASAPALALAASRTPAGYATIAAIARRDVVDLGRAGIATPVHVTLTLAYRHEADLDELVRLQGTPGSPLFGRFITPAQFAAYFSPSIADYARVVSSLQMAGFRVTPDSADRDVIDADAPAPVAEHYFATEIHQVAQAGHGIRYANVRPATMPQAIAANVTAVLGLDNLVKFESARSSDVPANDAVFQPAQAKPLGGPIERTSSSGTFEGLYPTGLAIAYTYPTQSGYNGKGHAIAIVIDSDLANHDIVTYWTAAGIKRTGSFARVLVNGSNPGVTADVGETAIDVDMATSLAPGANVYLYLVSGLTDTTIEDAYDLAVKNGKLDVVSSSFGSCELSDTQFASATNAVAVKGGSEGMTFTASTGDSGGDCRSGSAFEPDIVNSPASNPAFLAIGGTTLTIDPTTGARISETAWGPGGDSGGAGGGVSSYWPLPSYQKGVDGIAVVPTIKVKPPGTQPKSGFAGRNVPDIALDASDRGTSYVAIYYARGGWTAGGGTSVASPMYAALIADQNQQKNALSGVANYALYAAYTNKGAQPAGIYGTQFFDVTSGSIGAGWTAKTGYDQATGIGSVLNGAL
jgi:pseudomonalisin